MKLRVAVVLAAAMSVVGCAGKVDYVRPAKPAGTSNMKTIESPRSEVWDSAVPELGKRFFVINNLDKSSGLINISYSGDPQSYVDCGRVTSYVKNMRGQRTYDFPGAKAQQTYEVMNGNGLFIIDRKMSLEGRVNLIFEEVAGGKTRVTANTKYIVTRSGSVRNEANQFSQPFKDTVSFNSGGSAYFPASADGRAAECVATGKLEREILSAIK